MVKQKVFNCKKSPSGSHHFLIGEPNDTAFVEGKCKYCGTVREHRVSEEPPTYNRWMGKKANPKLNQQNVKGNITK